jgi:DNA polymerase-3 subunit gamma/tau
VSDQAVALVARAAEGSMRDAQTAFDQVLAFAGTTVGVDDVALVLGLVGRDLLFDVLTAVADENGAAAFELAGLAVEAGYDLKLLCRELARLVRDLLVLSIDETRFADTDIAPEQDHQRLKLLLPRFSREDLLRAFDVLARAESEIRNAAEPRYHLEMALLRWIHLRKLTPLSDLIDQLQGRSPAAAGPARATAPPSPGRQSSSPSTTTFPAPSTTASSGAPPSSSAAVARRVASQTSRPPAAPASSVPPPSPAANVEQAFPPPVQPAGAPVSLKDTYLDEIRKSKGAFHGAVAMHAQRIEFESDRIVFRFTDAQIFLADQVWQYKDFLEKLALEVFGRRLAVAAESVKAETSAHSATSPGASAVQVKQAADLKAEAMASPTVQTLLEIFPADITDVTELKKKS